MTSGISVGAVPVYSLGFGDWFGGGFFVPGVSIAKLSLTDSTVSGNSAVGVNIVNGEADVIRSVISGNTGYSGGGISVGSGWGYSWGSLTLTDSIVSDNTSTYAGGGINVVSGRAAINHSTITGNVAGFSADDAGRGGGINVNPGSSTVSIARSTISGNSADEGGGINFSAGLASALTVEETTISRNKVTSAGG